MHTCTRRVARARTILACLLLLMLASGRHLDAQGRPARTAAYYTYQQQDGNRVVTGKGAVPQARIVDIPVPARPEWLVAAPLERGSLWVALLADGSIRAWHVLGLYAEPRILLPLQLRRGSSLALLVTGTEARVLLPPLPGMASPLSHPVLVSPRTGVTAFLDAEGGLRLWDRRETARLDIQALPDARVLVDTQGRLLLFTQPTTRYAHGVLGDKVEAAGMTLIETTPRPRVVHTTRFPDDVVAEGIAPIWADINGDDQPDIIVTLSDAQQGARLAVFNEAGERIASGESIGQGQHWRHQIAVAPFGPQGEREIAAVRTPHLGGVVEFYRLVGNELRITAQVTGTVGPGQEPKSTDAAVGGTVTAVPLQGFGSHVLGSRNLDMAAAGDFDGDGRVELLVPNQQRTILGGIRRFEGGAAVVWTVPIGGQLTTNLAGVTLSDGTIAVGAGHDGGKVRLWLPY